MITVYHKIIPSFLVELNPDMKEYREVAIVDTNMLEEAFKLTNNIEEEWTKNQKVFTKFFNQRSTSVGDLMLFRDTFYAVDNIGFKMIYKDELC